MNKIMLLVLLTIIMIAVAVPFVIRSLMEQSIETAS